MVTTRSDKSRRERPCFEPEAGPSTTTESRSQRSPTSTVGATQGAEPSSQTTSRQGVPPGMQTTAPASLATTPRRGVPPGMQSTAPASLATTTPATKPTTFFVASSPASPTGPLSGVRMPAPPAKRVTASNAAYAVAAPAGACVPPNARERRNPDEEQTAPPTYRPTSPTTGPYSPPTPMPLHKEAAPTASRRTSRHSERTLRLARAKEDHLRAKTELARLQVETAAAHIAALEAEDILEMEEDARTEISENEAEQSQRVDTWLSEHHTHLTAIDQHEVPAITLPPPPQPSLPQGMQAVAKQSNEMQPHPSTATVTSTPPRNDIAELAAAITLAARQSKPAPPHRFYVELPAYDGSHREWLSFRAAYNETAPNLSDVENTGRLRRSLRGKAKEAVENLLLHYTQPQEVMRTLESRFGRPEAIATTELERLRALPRLNDNPRDICIFASRVSNITAALKALDRLYYLYNPDLTSSTTEKLPPTLRHRWFEFAAAQPTSEPDLLKLTRFLQREADLCSPYAQPEPQPTSSHTPREDVGWRRRPAVQRTHVTQVRSEEKCVICKNTSHDVTTCPAFKKADVNERWDLAKRNRLCFRCLRLRTKVHKCKHKKCGVDDCEYPHDPLLHHKKTPPHRDDKTESVASTWTTTAATAYLKIVPVTVSGPAGELDTWALLDDGSTVTLIDNDIAERVGAEGPVEPLYIHAIGDKKIDSSKSRRVSLTLSGREGSAQKLQLRTIPGLRLTPQQVKPEDLTRHAHLHDLKHLLQAQHAIPKILIGQDNWYLLMTSEVRQGRRDQPVASRTPLGWVIHGANNRTRGHRVNFVSHTPTTEENMDEALRDYFALEGLTVAAKKPTNDPDERAVKILRENTKRLPDAHYETALLWRTDNITMPNNYETALNRLKSVETKLRKDPEMKSKYTDQMNALTHKGYAEPAPPTSAPDKTWYLPHFGVTTPMKPDKLRIVHDAAAKTRGRSLNDYLLTGPDLLQSLPGVLMRFRQHSVAVSADITEMFMQVKVRPEDRDALRYLWRESPDQPPKEFRMTSVIFGATSSPATAIFVKNMNAEKHRKEHPEAADAIVRNHYMDDYLGSYRTIEEAKNIAAQVRDIHQQAHFELRKWNSNEPEVRRHMTSHDESPPDVTLTDASKSERVLGLVWKPTDDTLGFNLDMARVPPEVLNSDAPTKRQALRIVMSIYDPLGLASPITVRAKQILQEVWRRGTGWDERLDEELAVQWQEWMTHLRRLRHVSVPRCYLGNSDVTELQLHTFVDASEEAYAAALYWRAVMPDGEIRTSLVLGKARVAPLKLTSIPRLELQAAVMGSRMAAAVTEEHDRKPDKRYFWTDSTTALTWLRTGSRSYRPFVAHRIAAIEENTMTSEWRWVPTKLNVADDATRHVPADFDSGHRWYTGPTFLHESEDQWPTQKTATIPDVTGEERCHSMTTKSPRLSESLPNAERFSTWERYVRTTARVLQFIDLCTKKRERTHYKRTRAKPGADPKWTRQTTKKHVSTSSRQQNDVTTPMTSLDGDTLRRAEKFIWRRCQEEVFCDEIEDLGHGRPVARNSRLRPLSVVYADGLIRINSRITKIKDAPEITRSPPVLDGNRHEVKLLIGHIHRQLHHGGTEATMSECRQHYWVLRLRPVTKTVVSRCLPCRIRRDAPPRPATGDHPSCRLAHHQRAFTYTGVDYCGPFSIAVGRNTQKRYVAVFTCLTTRAVHLELAASLSTDSAVMALRRMIARRGTPTEIWSDNGTNLKGADRELRQAMDRSTEEEASKTRTNWRYIPPGAPFMGGAWERMVRAVKTALAATQQPRHPTDETFATLLAEAEFTVNSRPLTHVSVSADDPEPLTPNHFLLGGPARVPALGAFDDRDLIGRAHWRASQRLADIFWSRWLREYLPDLQHRREPHSRGPAVQVGNVVLIADNTLPRNTWPRGVIEAVYPGPDAVTRAVDVRTIGGLLRRPVKKLIILPTTDDAHPARCNTPEGDARRENVRDTRKT